MFFDSTIASQIVKLGRKLLSPILIYPVLYLKVIGLPLTICKYSQCVFILWNVRKRFIKSSSIKVSIISLAFNFLCIFVTSKFIRSLCFFFILNLSVTYILLSTFCYIHFVTYTPDTLRRSPSETSKFIVV